MYACNFTSNLDTTTFHIADDIDRGRYLMLEARDFDSRVNNRTQIRVCGYEIYLLWQQSITTILARWSPVPVIF